KEIKVRNVDDMEELYQQLEQMNERLTAQIEGHLKLQSIYRNFRSIYKKKKEKLEERTKVKKAKKEIYRTYPTSWRPEKTETKTEKTYLQQALSYPAGLNNEQMLTDIEPMAEGTNKNEKSETPNRNCRKIVNIEEDKNGIEVEKDKCKALRYLPMYGPCIFDPGGLTLSRGT
ncbi:13744_t:CDS:2, partial [Cetraspora pellucida]